MRIIRAGLPITIVFAGTSLVTTEPAPTIAFFPITIPGKIIAPDPMLQFFSRSVLIGDI